MEKDVPTHFEVDRVICDCNTMYQRKDKKLNPTVDHQVPLLFVTEAYIWLSVYAEKKGQKGNRKTSRTLTVVWSINVPLSVSYC